ncbi:hypothetical protein COK37_20855 [Bacillus thuringiensis]|uniref:hypothetical protein n=1 Tax=Bacillus thuringiensis TaxID=1428 RepID=UPI000BF51041|nr:hypothetical protein [Bacillus thuringiensis]PEV50779.1 hypothetical protein CN432_09250 [Bacillus thuringiensis]PFR65805.1 hypothetical protein COK37_20855 [Bacillus thuringiensis]PFT77404.1 hypothetical protein COK70_19630 [Bacillus thuringiensis]PFV87951.1 hypothetical protein COL06_15295 [Bacillus thuringiensis]
MDLFISNLEALYIEEYQTVTEHLQDLKCGAVNSEFNSMFEAYGHVSSVVTKSKALDSFKKHMYIIPISQKNVVEMSGEVVNKSLEGVSTEDITHLIYCHELLNLPQPITVAMNIKKQGNLSRALPYAIKDQGACVSLTGINIANMFIEGHQKFQIICADKCNLPQNRLNNEGFPYGDGAVSFTISKDHGNFKIISWKLYTWYLEEYDNFEESIKSNIEKYLFDVVKGDSNKIPDYVILQNYSLGIINYLKDKFNNIHFYQRSYRNTANLSTSDPYYSLKELYQENKMSKGKQVLLIFAGSKGTIGALLLECT